MYWVPRPQRSLRSIKSAAHVLAASITTSIKRWASLCSRLIPVICPSDGSQIIWVSLVSKSIAPRCCRARRKAAKRSNGVRSFMHAPTPFNQFCLIPIYRTPHSCICQSGMGVNHCRIELIRCHLSQWKLRSCHRPRYIDRRRDSRSTDRC